HGLHHAMPPNGAGVVLQDRLDEPGLTQPLESLVVAVSEVGIHLLKRNAVLLTPLVNPLVHSYLHAELSQLPEFPRLGGGCPVVYLHPDTSVHELACYPPRRILVWPADVLLERSYPLGEVRVTTPDRRVGPP